MEQIEINCTCNKFTEEKTIRCMDCGYHFHISCVGIQPNHTQVIETFSCKFCCSFSEKLFILNNDNHIMKLIKNNSFDHLKMYINETQNELKKIEEHISKVESNIGSLQTELVFNDNMKPAFAAKLKYVATEKVKMIKKLMEYNISLVKFHTYLDKHSLGKRFLNFMKGLVWDRVRIDEMKKKLDDFIHENGKKPIVLNKEKCF